MNAEDRPPVQGTFFSQYTVVISVNYKVSYGFVPYHDTAGILLQWWTHCSKNCKNLKIIFICIIFYFTTNLFVFVVLKNFHDIPMEDLIQNIPPGSLYLKILRFCYFILIIFF